MPLFGNDARAHNVKLDSSYVFHCPELEEITEPGPVIAADGTARCAWGKKPVLTLNFDDARFAYPRFLQQFRMKKWDMYHIYTPEHMIHYLVAWIGYGAFCAMYVYDRAECCGDEDFHARLPFPAFPMLPDSTTGRTEYKSGRINATFEIQGESHRLKVKAPKFADKGFESDIELIYPADHESIFGVHLTTDRRCHYGHKINCMPANGWYKLGGQKFELEPETSTGALDFGRGHYPNKLFWYWATASGRDENGKLIGVNLGYGNSEDNCTENAVFYDGRMTKIGRVKCFSPADDLMKPWRVRDEQGLVDLTMTPHHVRYGNTTLGVFYSIARPSIGVFNGQFTTDRGETVMVKDLFGMFEWVDSKW